jgi:hypothetical protein
MQSSETDNRQVNKGKTDLFTSVRASHQVQISRKSAGVWIWFQCASQSFICCKFGPSVAMWESGEPLRGGI